MCGSLCLWLWGTGPLTGEVPGLGSRYLMSSLGRWPRPTEIKGLPCVERKGGLWTARSSLTPDPSLARTPGKMRLQSCDVN